MRRVKARFDPYDTLNPGLLLPAPTQHRVLNRNEGDPWA